MEKVHSIFASISRVLSAGATICILAVIGISSADVLVRYANGNGLVGAIQVVELLLVILTALGLMVAQHHRDHVSIDLVAVYINRTAARYLQAIGFAFVAVMFTIASLFAIGSAFDSIVRQEVSVGILELQVWPARFAVAIGMLALAAQLVLDAIETFTADDVDVREEVIMNAESELL